jgi:protein-disulfide isomerase/uncharacterized membrane protein
LEVLLMQPADTPVGAAPPARPVEADRPCLPPFVQPKQWIRWVAVLLAAGGWLIALESCRISAGAPPDPFMQALCGSAPAGSSAEGPSCTDVLRSPQAYLTLGPEGSGLKMPVSTLGAGYFAFLGLWYLFVGPPTRARRGWHLLLAAVLLCGAADSAHLLWVMHAVLHRWCVTCVAAHAINGALILLSILAWPWRAPRRPSLPHPSGRLALATATAGLFVMATHIAVVIVLVAGTLVRERTDQLAAIYNDREFLAWDFDRQKPVALPLYENEVFGGAASAPNTLVVFGDFECPACKQLHEKIGEVLEKYPGLLRVAFRYYPQDSECNPNPRFIGASHPSACQAARAAEAARVVGGREAYLAMRKLLWEHQNDLPKDPPAQQSPAQRRVFEDWAAGLGLDRVAFARAMDSAAVKERIAADVQLANRLNIQALPVMYLNGKLLRGWSRAEVWDAVLGATTQPASQPTSAPQSP